MDAFKGITFEDLVKKYEKNELEMVRDLMKAGLLNPIPEECHRPMHIHGSDPWHWRCPKRECSSKKSVVKGSFLEGKRKYLNVVKALYLWSQGLAPKNIKKEAKMGHVTLRKLMNEWRELITSQETSKLGGEGVLVEGDEVAVGGRKYQRGKRQRTGGVQWVRRKLFSAPNPNPNPNPNSKPNPNPNPNSNPNPNPPNPNPNPFRNTNPSPVQTLLEVEEDGDHRKAKKLRAFVVDNRTGDTLIGNISKSVNEKSRIQTDGWRSYHRLSSKGYVHDSVNHKQTFVRKTKQGKVTTNTVESTHSALKRRARQTNMFQGTSSTDLNPKIQELVFRFNNRDGDMFVCFLSLLSISFPVLNPKDLATMLSRLHL